MSTLNNARTLSILNVKASTAMPAVAKTQPLPSAQNDSSRDTFSRMLERSRADSAAERHDRNTVGRPDTHPASDSQAARHAAKEDEPRRRERASSSDTDTHADADVNADDTGLRASTVSRGRGADTARARADRTADDDASTESVDATRPAADEEATCAQADATTADVMSTLAGVMPPVVPTVPTPAPGTTAPTTRDGTAAADPALAHATGAAIPPLTLPGWAEGRIGSAGSMRANASHAAPEAVGDLKDGSTSGLAQPVPAPASPAPAFEVPAQPAAVPEAALAQLAALSGRADETRKLPSTLEVLPAGSSAALAHPGVGPLNRASDSPALPTATVSTAVTDSGFQEALATQVSVFARGGLSKAELHLNPAELGPVSVQITMQGDQARVDFGAERAQTRQAIEAGWAALAASLQDAGFTLSGGGVSEQAGRQAAEQQAASQTGRSGRATTTLASDDLPATSIVAARPRAGAALDLYA